MVFVIPSEMASTNVCLCGCFVETPVKFTFKNVPLTFKHKTGGGIFWFRKTATSPLEVAVVLGVGGECKMLSCMEWNALYICGLNLMCILLIDVFPDLKTYSISLQCHHKHLFVTKPRVLRNISFFSSCTNWCKHMLPECSMFINMIISFYRYQV